MKGGILVDAFITLAEETRIEYIIEKSRFIATAAPCRTEEEVRAFYDRITKEFWDASHNCTAYALGPRQEQQRSSDNGEPSGTAGKPILEVLKKTGITDTAIVVTRYFGGIKLGAGGLIRAYSHSAAEVLQAAPKLENAPRQILYCTVPYNQYGAVERYTADQGLHVEPEFGEAVTLTLYIPPADVATVQTEMTNLTDGTAQWAEGDVERVTIPLRQKSDN